MKIFNSLTRELKEFVPADASSVKMYTCGPTVYSYPTIGNWRTYVLSDLMLRALTFSGFKVDFVMNLTDVGHLVSDADTGEDKLEKGARREGKTAWEVAKFYGDDFVESFAKLNLVEPKIFSKATDNIKEQIELVEKIQKAGFAYTIEDGIYFDVAAYEKAGNIYGELSDLDQIKAGARVEVNNEKKDQRDFALWKFSPSTSSGQKRDMEWESPWGVGFPGWHIECSAMSMKYLGEQIDIHIGGEDLRSTHHPNEIAQSEAATGKKPFSKYWVHGAFLLVDGGRMGKSLGNAYTLQDVIDKGFDPLALRYFYLTGHYRKQINFTWEALSAARIALNKLWDIAMVFGNNPTSEHVRLSDEIKEVKRMFGEAVNNDLNMPNALAVFYDGLKVAKTDDEKMFLMEEVDKIFGLKLREKGITLYKKSNQIPEKIKELSIKREQLRAERKFAEADEVRRQLEEMGYRVLDTDAGAKLVRE